MNTVRIRQARSLFLAALDETEGMWEHEAPLLDLYTLLALTKGGDCTADDIVTAQEIAYLRGWMQSGPLELTFPPDLREALEFRDAVGSAAAELARRDNDRPGGVA